ncbi:MAG TPA: VOC family protein [Vicinamibacterales bacterium]|jgi:lactoylglutathione lyase
MKLLLALLVLVSTATVTADPPRPRIAGLAHVGLFVHDVEKARAYYRDLLGYTEVFPVRNDDGSLRLTYFKVNDRQYIELFPERAVGTDRLAHVAFETDNAEALRQYLKAKGVAVPDKVNKGRIGNTAFTVKDPDGHIIEFVQYEPDGMTVKESGKSLGTDRVSPVMRHAGFLVGTLDASMTFYRDLLGFRETWRGSRDGTTLDWVNLQMPDSEDYIEFMLYRDLPAEHARGSQNHLCLVVPDITAAAATVQARAPKVGYSRPVEVRTGVNRKRQLNLFDPDGTRSELMEPQTIDGKPTPSSAAPPPVRAGR